MFLHLYKQTEACNLLASFASVCLTYQQCSILCQGCDPFSPLISPGIFVHFHPGKLDSGERADWLCVGFYDRVCAVWWEVEPFWPPSGADLILIKRFAFSGWLLALLVCTMDDWNEGWSTPPASYTLPHPPSLSPSHHQSFRSKWSGCLERQCVNKFNIHYNNNVDDGRNNSVASLFF